MGFPSWYMSILFMTTRGILKMQLMQSTRMRSRVDKSAQNSVQYTVFGNMEPGTHIFLKDHTLLFSKVKVLRG
ncbi:hypothetical protein DCAR_0728894 [Daucus carota subsp. sativus]|uniref:Uncharacterized protein n=1 Tax=Daucus carota subsp. sativus TaxID=79200 RepID=A0A161Y6W3_DAUCS|nr:hypothetical protein DCAR_0728894 [Daucus carota subsp. sativus]